MLHSKMVATRRTTRVSSPVKECTDEPESEPPSTIRTTRRRTIILTVQSEAGQENDSQAEEESTTSAKPVASPKKETRSSRRRPTEQQPDSTHEADVSESESCCSEVSDVAGLQPTPRRTTRQRSTAAEKQQATKVECPSVSVRTPRKSTRGQKNPSSSLKTSSQEEDQSEAESCSSLASLSKVSDARMRTRSSIKTSLPSEDAGDSCSSTASGAFGSTIRRSTRSRATLTKPIPINLDQGETPRTSRIRAQRAKEKAVSEDQALESDDCQSGPSSSPLHRSAYVVFSDSEVISAASMSHEGSCKIMDMPCNVSEKGDAKVILEKLNIPSVISEVGETKDDVQKDKAEDVDAPSQSGGEDMSDAEEMETGVNNTVIDVDGSILEDFNADVTLTPEKDNKQEDDKDNQTFPTGGSVIKEVVESEAKENQTEQKNAQAVAQQSSCSPIKSVKVSKAETVQSDPTEEVLIKKNQRSILVEHKSEEGLDEDKEKAVFVVDEGCSVAQDTSEVPECSSSEVPSNVQKKKTPKISLLDSSEDEDSDDGLSDEEDSKIKDQDMESEEVPSDENQAGPSEALDSPAEGLFVIDTHPGLQPGKTYYIDRAPLEGDGLEDSKANEEDEDFVDEDGDEEEDEDSKVLFSARKSAMPDLSSSIDPGLNLKDLGGLYISFGGNKSKTVSNNLKKLKEQKKQEELLKKSVIGGDFEKKDAVPPYKESKRVAKLKRKEERSKTTGDGWYNMKAPELTEELKNDLKALKMRSAMDPKRFYKKNDREGFPKYFQVGTVIDNPVDFYHSRIPKKDRKRTIVEELLADAEFRSYNKRKYQEIMTEKAAEAAGKIKKHKFHKKK